LKLLMGFEFLDNNWLKAIVRKNMGILVFSYQNLIGFTQDFFQRKGPMRMNVNFFFF
jgi:hypothetical protein